MFIYTIQGYTKSFLSVRYVKIKKIDHKTRKSYVSYLRQNNEQQVFLVYRYLYT